MYVYIRSEPSLWTVGHYKGGEWIAESDWNSTDEAAYRVAWLNGGGNGMNWNDFLLSRYGNREDAKLPHGLIHKHNDKYGGVLGMTPTKIEPFKRPNLVLSDSTDIHEPEEKLLSLEFVENLISDKEVETPDMGDMFYYFTMPNGLELAFAASLFHEISNLNKIVLVAFCGNLEISTESEFMRWYNMETKERYREEAQYYSRAELIELCEEAVVPHTDWLNRDSYSAQVQLNDIYRALTSGMDFSLDVDGHTIWIEFETDSGDGLETGKELRIFSLEDYWRDCDPKKESEMFDSDGIDFDDSPRGYLPTLDRLYSDREDWY